jgi:hypothetical protein
VKGKVVLLSILAVIAALALSATVAQAGAGGTPSLLTGFLVCHGIHGEDPGEEFEVESPVFGPVDPGTGASILQKIKLGKAALACAFARLFPPGSSAVPPGPERDALAIEPGEGLEAKCYPISNSQKAKVKPPAEYIAFDALVGTEVDLAVPSSKLVFLCAPASFFAQ